MPYLVRLYIKHSLIGLAIAAVFVALILWFNVANLWHLVTHTSAGPLAVFLLWLFNGIVFSGVQFGIALTHLSETPGKDGDDRGARDPVPSAARARAEMPVAVPVKADTPRIGA